MSVSYLFVWLLDPCQFVWYIKFLCFFFHWHGPTISLESKLFMLCMTVIAIVNLVGRSCALVYTISLCLLFLFFGFLDEFENVIKKTTFFNKIKFNFDTEFVQTYFGTDKKRQVRFDDFSHLLQVSSVMEGVPNALRLLWKGILPCPIICYTRCSVNFSFALSFIASKQLLK